MARGSSRKSVGGDGQKQAVAQALRRPQQTDQSTVPPKDLDPPTETQPLLGTTKADRPAERNVSAEAAREFVEKMFMPGMCLRVLIMMFLPWLVFVFAVLAFMHAHHPEKFVRLAAVMTIAGIFLAGFFLFRRRQRHHESLLNVLLAVSVIMGALAGGLCYCSGAIDYWAFEDRWQYTNVWPTELASAHRDASAFVFAEGAMPDTVKGTGYYHGGHTYCVAPITMGVSSLGVPDIQYWAAGRDCCQGDGKFTCDDAGVDNARAGLVVYNHTFAFYSAIVVREVDYYVEAARRAKIKFNIVSTSDQPIFVRWVRDLEEGRLFLWRRSMVLALELILGYLPISILFGFFTPALQLKSLQPVPPV